MHAANFCFLRYIPHFFEDLTCIFLRIPAIAFLRKSRFSFSRSTSFIILSFTFYMYVIRITFQIAFSDSVKCTLNYQCLNYSFRLIFLDSR